MADVFSLEVLGARELVRKVQEAPQKVRNGIERKALVRVARLFIADAKGRTPVLTGQMRRSHKSRAAKKRPPRGEVRPRVVSNIDPGATAQEFGTSRHPPQPFYRPTISAAKPLIVQIFLQQIREQTRAAFK